MASKTIPLHGIQIGTASAGLQNEGSPAPSNWTEWADAGNIKDGTGMHSTLDGLLAAAGLPYLGGYLGGYPGLYQACAVACLLGAGLALTVRSSR